MVDMQMDGVLLHFRAKIYRDQIFQGLDKHCDHDVNRICECGYALGIL